ncbi:MAG TPA: EamA family transporter [Acidimicrobiales bacterium]|nr:EamA family transporter [Acidimicrobiales bacterium]
MRRVVLLSFIWGWSFLLIKVALGGMTPATVAFARIALGMAVMVGVLRARGARLPRDRTSWRHFAVMGLAYSAFPFTLLAWGEQHITSALAAVVNATTGLFAALAAAVGLHERLRPPQIAGLVVGFAGVAVAAGLTGSDLTSSSAAGIVATLAVSASYGFSFVYAQRNLTGTPPLIAAAGQLVTAAAMALPLAVVSSVVGGFSPNPRQLLAVAVLGVVGTGLAYVVNYRAIADVGSTKASLVTYLVPIVAVTVGVVFLDEPFHASLVVGGALVVAGMALVQGRIRIGRPPAAALLLLIAVLVAGSCGKGGSCGGDLEDPLDPGSLAHVLPGAPEPRYLTDPPSSGAHAPGGAPAGGVVDAPLSRPLQVTVLEGGGVLIQYRGAAPKGVLALAGPKVVVAPNPDLPSDLVATAWRHRLVCAGDGDLAALRSFIDAHRGGGPSD